MILSLSLSNDTYYKELDHTAKEVEKSHNLLSAGWRSRETSGTVKMPESQSTWDDSSQSLKAQEPGAMSAGED